ncbi:MAG: leucine-rich repeat domain-containing protein [Anaerolineae bacterium]|nr:leucine-rich repeat domain-containing protein [Anaerolineae bacterium]
MTLSARYARLGLLVALLLALVFVIAPVAPVEAAPSRATDAERDSLMSIYNHLGGPGWATSTNWGVGDPCTNGWTGVTCDPGGNVTNVFLASNNLTGDIDNIDLSGLTSLTQIVLLDNQLTGDINKVDLDGLANLVWIDLDDNQIGGNLNKVNLSKLPSLETIWLRNNYIKGNIGKLDLSSVPNLIRVDLSGNQIRGDLSGFALGDIPNLQNLYLQNNQIDGTLPTITTGWPALIDTRLCGGDNIIRPSGVPGVDWFVAGTDATGWTAEYGCPQLAASVRCDNDDLEVRIDQGDGPFSITGTGSQLPILGSALRIDTPALDGPGTWTGVTVTEEGGAETINFGDFECTRRPGGDKGETVTVEPSVEPAPAPDVQIVLTGSPSQSAAAPGDVLTWTFTVTNQGSAASGPLSFSAMLPDSLTGVTVTTTQGTVIYSGPPTASVDLGSIPAGGSVTITLSGAWGGGTAQRGVRARVMPGHANQEAGESVCVLGMVADQSLNVCVTNFPSALPSTGGQPVEPLQWGWIAAAALMIGAGAWFAVRRKATA